MLNNSLSRMCLLILLLSPFSAQAGTGDIASCVMHTGVGKYQYDMMDRYGRVGPYRLSVKDLFDIGVCQGRAPRYGVTKNWKLCDFGGLAGQDNRVTKLEHLQSDKRSQDFYFSVISNVIHKRFPELTEIKGINSFRSYPYWEKMLNGLIYMKGYKAVQFRILSNLDVADKKDDISLNAALATMRRCYILKNPGYATKIKWGNFDVVRNKAAVKDFKWKRFDADSDKVVAEYLYKNPELLNFAKKGMITPGRDRAYMYDRVDIDGNGKLDTITKLIGPGYNSGSSFYHIVFYDSGKVEGFYASRVRYVPGKLVVNGYIIND